MYSPLKRWGAGPGTRLVIAGLGGLGITGIKIAKVMGCHVTAISRSRKKEQLVRNAGADEYLALSEPESIASAQKSLDLILDTLPCEHSVSQYVRMLKTPGRGNCRVVCLGATTDLAA